MYARAQKKVMTVRQLVKEHPTAKAIWGFQPFASAGHVPKALVADKERSFCSNDRSTLPQAIAAASISKSIELLFVMKFDEGKKEIQLAGVTLVTTSQLVLKSGVNELS